MAKIEITGILGNTVLKVDGQRVPGAFKVELTSAVDELPVVKISVLATELLVDVDEAEGMIERIPIVREKTAVANA